MHESAIKIDRHAASADIAALSVLLPCCTPVNVTTYLSVSEREREKESGPSNIGKWAGHFHGLSDG